MTLEASNPSPPSTAQSTPLPHARLFVISGPSGVGKGTLCRAIREAHPDWLWSISMTTRAPRDGDIPNQDYYFTTTTEFKAAIAQGELLEWAQYGEQYYGTPKSPLAQALSIGKTVLMEIDVQGAQQVKKSLPEAVLVFILPPSIAELEARLRNRGNNAEADIQRRLQIAQNELALAPEFDAQITNQTIPQALADFEALAHTTLEGAA